MSDPIMDMIEDYAIDRPRMLSDKRKEMRDAIEREVAALRERAVQAECERGDAKAKLARELLVAEEGILRLARERNEARQRIADLEAENAALALQRFNEFVSADDDMNALERLRAFCSFAMKGQDWIDVEPFFAAVEAERAALMSEKESTCGWYEDGDDSEVYQSQCGMTWQFNDGGPAENSMTFCHGCGKRIDIQSEAENEK